MRRQFQHLGEALHVTRFALGEEPLHLLADLRRVPFVPVIAQAVALACAAGFQLDLSRLLQPGECSQDPVTRLLHLDGGFIRIQCRPFRAAFAR